MSNKLQFLSPGSKEVRWPARLDPRLAIATVLVLLSAPASSSPVAVTIYQGPGGTTATTTVSGRASERAVLAEAPSTRSRVAAPRISREVLRAIAALVALVALSSGLFGIQTVRLRRSGMEGASGILHVAVACVLIAASAVFATV